VAGVIGIQRFIYDILGNTANTASRMESEGVVNCVQLTESAYKHLNAKYACESKKPL